MHVCVYVCICDVCVCVCVCEGFTPEVSPHGNDKTIKPFYPTLPSTKAEKGIPECHMALSKYLLLYHESMVEYSMLQALVNCCERRPRVFRHWVMQLIRSLIKSLL